MTLLHRLLHRSGELSFLPGIAEADRNDVRHDWLNEWIGPAVHASRVLDVGCWVGRTLQWAQLAGAREVGGVDLDGPWLAAAHRRVPDAQIFAVDNLCEIDSSRVGMWDVVLFLETLEHLPRGSESTVMRALAEIIRPGGFLVLSTPTANVSALLDPAWTLFGHRHYRVGTLESLATAAGVVVREKKFSGNTYTSLDSLVMYGFNWILKRNYEGRNWLAERGNVGLMNDWGATRTSTWLLAEVL